jgi:hypothetical protein
MKDQELRIKLKKDMEQPECSLNKMDPTKVHVVVLCHVLCFSYRKKMEPSHGPIKF